MMTLMELNLTNELSIVSGDYDHAGFHTVNLDTNVAVIEGEDFYVYLSLSSGGHPYDRTSDIPVLLGASYRTIVESSSNPEESYYKNGGNWLDFYNYNDPSGFQNTGNFCIKALSIEGLNPPQNVIIEIIGTDAHLSWDAVTGANSYKIYSSDNPYTGFVEDTTGTFTGESWNTPIESIKRFYYVKASTGVITH